MLSARVNVASTSALRVAPSSARAHSRGALVVVAASKKKDVRLQVTLECTEQKESGVMGMSRYITQKVRARRRMRWVNAWTRSEGSGVGRRRDREGGDARAGPGFRARRLTTTRRDDGAQNRRNTSQRIELMKYNPFLKRHTLHRELKK